MSKIEHLGQLVCQDREKLKLTQDDLVVRLNRMDNRPGDPLTKNLKVAYRSWIAKLEGGSLRRGLRSDVRHWLAKALDGDVSLYEELPLRREAVIPLESDYDILPLIKHIARSTKKGSKLTLGEFQHLCEAHKLCSGVGVSLLNPLSSFGKKAR